MRSVIVRIIILAVVLLMLTVLAPSSTPVAYGECRLPAAAVDGMV